MGRSNTVPTKKRDGRKVALGDIQSLAVRTDKEIADYIRRLATPGQPPKVIDPRRVLELRSCGCSINEIAAKLGISEKTLDRAIQKDQLIRKMFEVGDDYGKADLRSAQHIAAVVHKVPAMLVWCGKNRLGQKDQHEIGGMTDTAGNPTGVPVQFVLTPAQSEMCGDPVSEA